MNPWNRICQAARLLGPGYSFTVTTDAILAETDHDSPASTPAADLTVDGVAERMRRKPSTVRGWLVSGDLDGYKLRGRDWRVTEAALAAFIEKEKAPRTKSPRVARTGKPADLGAWRKGRAA